MVPAGFERVDEGREGGSDDTRADRLAVSVEVQRDGARVAVDGQADEGRARRLPVLGVGTGRARRRDADVGGAPVDRACLSDAAGHLPRHVRVDRAVDREDRGLDPEDRGLRAVS